MTKENPFWISKVQASLICAIERLRPLRAGTVARRSALDWQRDCEFLNPLVSLFWRCKLPGLHLVAFVLHRSFRIPRMSDLAETPSNSKGVRFNDALHGHGRRWRGREGHWTWLDAPRPSRHEQLVMGHAAEDAMRQRI
jgi:hypothetical protein